MTYTVEQVAVLTKAAEAGALNYERAKELAGVLGVSAKSVVAKIKSLDLPYEPMPIAPKRPKGLTKAELVRNIEAKLGLPAETLAGLEKAPASVLAKLS